MIVGNEPNLNRFWLPQFGRPGQDVAAPATSACSPARYDASRRSRRRSRSSAARSRTAGTNKRAPAATRTRPQTVHPRHGQGLPGDAAGTKPIMDAFAYHPYLEHADLPPTYQHYSLANAITIADYGKLVSLLGRAFDGTAQKGSKLPIVYDEFGVEARIPAALLARSTPAPSLRRRTRSTRRSQARYYAKAMQLAACQPTVRTFMVFRLIDRRSAAAGSRASTTPNGSPKSSLPRRRGGGAPPGGAAADRLRDAARAEAARLVLPGPPPDLAASRP